MAYLGRKDVHGDSAVFALTRAMRHGLGTAVKSKIRLGGNQLLLVKKARNRYMRMGKVNL